MDPTDQQSRLDLLRVEHRELDVEIAILIADGAPDHLRMARLKKRKLRLRDEMLSIETNLIPDITA